MRASNPDALRQGKEIHSSLKTEASRILAPKISLLSHPRPGLTPKEISGFCCLDRSNDHFKVTQHFSGRSKRRPSNLKTSSHSQDMERVVNGKHTPGTLSRGEGFGRWMLGVSLLPFHWGPLLMSVAGSQLSQLPGIEA